MESVHGDFTMRGHLEGHRIRGTLPPLEPLANTDLIVPRGIAAAWAEFDRRIVPHNRSVRPGEGRAERGVLCVVIALTLNVHP